MGWLRRAKHRWLASRCYWPWCLRHITYQYRCHLHQGCDTRGEVMDLPVICELVYSHRGWHKCGPHQWKNIGN